jgi:uncharacterized membrane protein
VVKQRCRVGKGALRRAHHLKNISVCVDDGGHAEFIVGARIRDPLALPTLRNSSHRAIDSRDLDLVAEPADAQNLLPLAGG